MHNLFLVYFVNLYIFRAYRGPSSGGTTYVRVYSWYLLFLDDNNSHLKRTLSTKCCIQTVVPPDDGPRYARNMYRLTKYTKNN